MKVIDDAGTSIDLTDVSVFKPFIGKHTYIVSGLNTKRDVPDKCEVILKSGVTLSLYLSKDKYHSFLREWNK